MTEGRATDNRSVDLRELHRDERGIVISWLVRIVVALAIVGVILFDAGAIVINYFSVNDAAQEVAVTVTTDLAAGVDAVPNLQCRRRSGDALCRQAYQVARERGVRIVSAHFDQRGVFHVEVRRTADTLVVGRIGAIEDWATVTASADADTN